MLDVIGKRAISEEPLVSRWQPVDLACEVQGSSEGDPGVEMKVRSKLVRGQQYAAMCVSKAVSLFALRAVGLPVASPCVVHVSSDFAASLTAQYHFEEAPVVAGRHWGTELMETDVLEVEFVSSHIDELVAPSHVFLLYVMDEVLAHRDRTTYGNVLLRLSEDGQRYDLIAIDQSDCFDGPDCLCNPESLRRQKTARFAQPLEGMDRVVLDGGKELVDNCFQAVAAARSAILDAVEMAPDEWYGRADMDPGALHEFLEHRLDTIEVLARADHWREMGHATGGGYVLNF